MTVDQVTKFYKSQAAAAEVLGLTRPIISIYKSKGGIPFDHQCTFEKASKGKLKARREDDPDNCFYKPIAA